MNLIKDAFKGKHKQTTAWEVPKLGLKKELIDHAFANAKASLERKQTESASVAKIFNQITEIFELSKVPERIEIYDNSHIQGKDAYGVMVVANQQGFDKKSYRKFSIKTLGEKGDDYGMMREVMNRRFAHKEEWELEEFFIKMMLSTIPNLLTLARIGLIPIMMGAFYTQNFLDGYVARIWSQTTKIGQFLDPVADKLLVASTLLMLAGFGRISRFTLMPAIIILCREIMVSGLREFLSDTPTFGSPFLLVGEGMLWVAAVMTLISGFDYFKAGYTVEELPAWDLRSWVNLIHPDDLEKFNSDLEKHLTGQIETLEILCRKKHKSLGILFGWLVLILMLVGLSKLKKN
eukprot:gene17409-17600_t